MENKQTYNISTSENEGILEIALSGEITRYGLLDLQKEINSLRKIRGNKIILDIRLLNGRSIDDFYHLRRPENDIGKTAILDLSENEYVKSCCEDLAKNTFLKMKWFSNIDDAKAWLKSK